MINKREYFFQDVCNGRFTMWEWQIILPLIYLIVDMIRTVAHPVRRDGLACIQN